MKLFSLFLVVGLLFARLAPTRAADGPALAAQIAGAKPGATVTIPAGTYAITGVDVPPGVNLKGAGYDQTVLTVTGQYGLHVKGGGKNEITDLTVRDAASAGVLIEQASNVTLHRVRVLRCLTGVLVTGSRSVRLENVVAGEDRTGIVLNDCEDSVVVNCSLVANTALGLSLGLNRRSAAFNNLIANSPIGVYVAPQNDTLVLDHNFYQTSMVGKSADTPPPNVYVWRDQTGYDAHSVQLPVDFAKPAEFDYQPVNPLAWAPERAVTTGWGVAKLGRFSAPERDLNGQPRRLGWGVGAWEAAGTAARPADGSFTIASADGTKSAGVYAKDGRLLVWLFQNLPLPRGTYRFWLPSRDWQGQPIPAGDYELRVVEANLRFRPVGTGIAANTGWGRTREGLAQLSDQQILFDSQQRPLITLGWTEGGMNVRAFNADLTQQRWFFPGTSIHRGAASDGHGNLYSLRQVGKELVLLKIDEESGQTKEIVPGAFNKFYTAPFSTNVNGMAVLGETLYVADPEKNKLFTAAGADRSFATGIDVASPSSPCADAKRGWVWLLSEKKRVLALDATGAIKVQFESPVAGPHSLAVNGDRLAILAQPEGKVHVFAIDDPAKPRPFFVIPTTSTDLNDGALSRVSLRANGDVGVVEPAYGVRLFDAAGKLQKEFAGGWYNSFQIGPPDKDGNLVTFDPSAGDRMCRLDSRHGTWSFAAPWQKQGSYSGMFDYQGKSHVLSCGVMPIVWEGRPTYRPYYCLSRREGDHSVPLLAFSNFWLPTNGTVTRTTFAGPLTAPFVAADWKPLVSAAGKPVVLPGIWGSNVSCQPNGDLLLDCGFYLYVPFKGLDARGVPIYDWDNLRRVEGHTTFTSPYDFKTKETTDGRPPNRVTGFFQDGGFAQPIALKTGKMTALTGNWSGTDLAGFGPQGELRWLQPLADIEGVHGGYIVDDIVYAVHTTTSETEVFAKDGLFLGRLGQPKELPWGGKWLDNALQFHPYRGADGKTYMLYGNFNDCCVYWMSIEGLDKVQRHAQPVKVDAAKATALAALPLPALPRPPAPPVTRIKIAKLAGPLPIDGALEKWRLAVPTPQVIMTPESGSPHIKGPADCSALIRFAHDGHDLYVQVIKFDNVVVMYQPLDKFYLQDGVELCLNSYVSGFKFNVTRLNALGDIILRDGGAVANKLLEAAKAPRKITVLDNARDVSERRFIENLYGVDLSQCKVIVTEFKLPLDADTYEGAAKNVPDTSSGQTMWIGVLVDDNDFPGGDVQEYESWPATYSTFSGKESGALATFE